MLTGKKIAVMTSGGDAPGMNAAIRAAVRTGIYEGMTVYGIRNGYEGLIDGEMNIMTSSSVSDILHRGGTILRTGRSKRFLTKDGQNKASAILKSKGITDLIVIGGDGSLHGALKIAERGINVIGLPGTIDNDLSYTEFSIGFDTAVNTAISAISNVRDTSSSHERATIIEVMGRGCGDIAIWAGISSGAESILIPEVDVSVEAICDKITQGRKRGKLHNIIVKAEGVSFDSTKLADEITKRTGMESRIVVLGYIQRGGSPTAKDRMMASAMAYLAIEKIKEANEKNLAIGITGGRIVSSPLKDALEIPRQTCEDDLRFANILSI